MASLLALAVAISWTLWKGKVLPEKVGTTKGVPMLPFENLSPDPDNAYFIEGIHEEILATIHDLKAISAIPRSATYSKLTRIRLRQVVHAIVARAHPRSVLSRLQRFLWPALILAKAVVPQTEQPFSV